MNTFEENQPVARYWVERVREEGFTSVECTHTRVIGLSSEDIDDVIDLATVMLSYVDRCREQEKSKVLKVVRTMPLEKVLSMAKEPTSPKTDNAYKSRKQRKPR